MDAERGGAFESITGTGDLSNGFDDADLQGGVAGSAADETQGSFGRSGFGPGGGGTGWGTIGTGRYGTIGHGSGTGAGYGVGAGRGGMRGRSADLPAVRLGQPAVVGDLDKAIIRRYIKRNIQRITYCYERELLAHPTLAGIVMVQFTIMPTGRVSNVTAEGVDPAVSSCIARVIGAIEYPHPQGGGLVRVRYPFSFGPDESSTTTPAGTTPAPTPATPAEIAQAAREAASLPPLPPPPASDPPEGTLDQPVDDPGSPDRGIDALHGKLAEVMRAIDAKRTDHALTLARTWHDEAPGDVLALIALGEALEANKDTTRAARVYGSIIDLFASRADLRRFAGERLERLGSVGRALSIDTYRRAVADRPDHATGHRLLAYALVRNNDLRGAFDAILAGVDQKYPDGRFRGADRVLGEDASMIAAAYIAAGGPRDHITAELSRRSLTPAAGPSTRFIMYWETDANDVDFHIYDARGGHAWYSHKDLESGGSLYADVTTGYGPECFAIQGAPAAGPYKLSINYYSQGPMGYGMGLLQIQRFDGRSFTFEDRPYVIMQDRAFVNLGAWSPS